MVLPLLQQSILIWQVSLGYLILGKRLTPAEVCLPAWLAVLLLCGVIFSQTPCIHCNTCTWFVYVVYHRNYGFWLAGICSHVPSLPLSATKGSTLLPPHVDGTSCAADDWSWAGDRGCLHCCMAQRRRAVCVHAGALRGCNTHATNSAKVPCFPGCLLGHITRAPVSLVRQADTLVLPVEAMRSGAVA